MKAPKKLLSLVGSFSPPPIFAVIAGIFLAFVVGCSDPIPRFDKTIDVGGVEFTFKGGYPIYYYEDESVQSGVLSGEHELDTNGYKITLKDLSQIAFYDDEKLAVITLSSDHEITVGSQEYTVFAGINFDSDGKVGRIFLTKDHTFSVGEDSYTFGGKTALEFYENGKVFSGTLSDDTLVYFNEDGSLYLD